MNTSLDQWNGQIYNLDDAYAYKLELKYLVDRFIPRASLNLFFGSPASMKSMILVDLCICISGNQDFLQFGSLEPMKIVEPVPTLWIDLDNGMRRTNERFAAMGRARNLKGDSGVYFMSLPNPLISWDSPQTFDMLQEVIVRKKIGFCVIDNLGVVKGSRARENDDSMTAVMNKFRQISEAGKVSMNIIHHIRKGFEKNGNTRLGEAIRGFSSIEAALDYAFYIGLVKNEKTKIEIVSAKSRDMDVKPFGAEFHFYHKEGTEDLLAAFYSGFEVEETNWRYITRKLIREALGSSRGKDLESVIERLMGIQMNRSQLIEYVTSRTKVSSATKVKKTLEEMFQNGEVIEEKGTRNEKLYSLP